MQAENTSDTSSTPIRFTYKGSGRKKSDAWLTYQVAVIAVLIVFVISMPFISKYRDRKQPVILDHLPMPPPLPANY